LSSDESPALTTIKHIKLERLHPHEQQQQLPQLGRDDEDVKSGSHDDDAYVSLLSSQHSSATTPTSVLLLYLVTEQWHQNEVNIVMARRARSLKG